MNTESIPAGFCQCGCGELAPIATKTVARRGVVRGQPIRFIHGHHPRVQPQKPFTPDLYTVTDHGYTTPCWDWRGCKDAAGYGRSRYLRRGCAAHRRAWFQLRGTIPPGLEIDHVCRNRGCVNPAHLELVTRRENVRRGRRTVMTFVKATTMREMFAAERVTKRELGRRFGVSEALVLQILRETIWTH